MHWNIEYTVPPLHPQPFAIKTFKSTHIKYIAQTSNCSEVRKRATPRFVQESRIHLYFIKEKFERELTPPK